MGFALGLAVEQSQAGLPIVIALSQPKVALTLGLVLSPFLSSNLRGSGGWWMRLMKFEIMAIEKVVDYMVKVPKRPSY